MQCLFMRYLLGERSGLAGWFHLALVVMVRVIEQCSLVSVIEKRFFMATVAVNGVQSTPEFLLRWRRLL